MAASPFHAQSEFTQLLHLINTSAHTVGEAYTDAGLPHPSSNNASSLNSQHATEEPATQRAVVTLIAACRQLIASVMPPVAYAIETSLGFQHSAAVRVAIEAHVAEAVRPTGDKGMHINDIAKYSNINPDKLARILRLLATNHIFKEVSPNVFANNRMSLALDTGKDAEILAKTDPKEFYEGTNGHAAYFAMVTDVVMKAAAHLPETLQSPETANSYDLKDAAVARGLNASEGFWDFMHQSGHERQLKTYNMAMVGTRSFAKDNTLCDRIGWEHFPSGSVCVDVGGGVGTQVSLITKAHPHLKMVVQDQAILQKQAEEFWASMDPDALPSGRVEWQGRDFFTPQPVKGAAVYILRLIIHDWADEDALRILAPIREACSPDSKIIIGEDLISFTCPPGDGERSLVRRTKVPAPLLSNMGLLREYLSDIAMMGVHNGQERTIEQWLSLTKRAHLKINRVCRMVLIGAILITRRIVGDEGAMHYFVCSPSDE
ncbi:hypothetical protein BOTBODRAFT_636425 [Botryobasidium botryosum FD-172 SS1]|uniref:Uncharacterized protein n=1 Tax=Botryobasidium botryosum (strain FD-172 SS1) TaxID=930990 RepID=A0A067MXU5_BOTB1|nr:hypothetical protein BOTBODRAFT_636425 [Botryobasidium botryosum FD-172 SS1]